MKNFYRALTILSIIIAVSVTALAQDEDVSKVGSSAATFLKIGVGSKAMAMGESFVALANDVSAVYWNPAGLAQLHRNEAMLSHLEWLADITYNNVAVAIPMGGSGTFGLWANSLGMPEDLVRTVFEPEGTGEKFTASSLALGLSYGRFLTNKFSIGGTIKYVREQIWSMKAAAIGFDIGTLYKSDHRNMQIGIGLFNFGSKMKMSGRGNLMFVDPDPFLEGHNEKIRAELEMESWDIPMMLRTGVSMDILNFGSNRVTIAGSQNYPNDNSEYFNIGGEFAMDELIFLRAGFRGMGLDESEGGFSVGGGVNIELAGAGSLMVDYAYTDWGRLTNVQRFSLSASF